MTNVDEEFKKFYGFYRSLVTLSKDPLKFGRVKIWIPDVMPKISKYDSNSHLWARPGNNPMGGRNKIDKEDNYFTGTSYIPREGSWVWIFFENGNLNRPYYWAAVDIEHSPVLPENQFGYNYEDKWVMFKSNQGRCAIFSDDSDDARVEITGKKRKLKNPPSGDIPSVFNIVDNQTSILLDERSGYEKILIKTYKGDFLNFDIEERKLHIYSEDDINIKTDATLNIIATKDINVLSDNNVNVDAKGNISFKTDGEFNIDANRINISVEEDFNLKSDEMNLGTENDFNLKSEGAISIDADDYIGIKTGDNIYLTADDTIHRHTGGPLKTNNGVHVGDSDEAEEVDQVELEMEGSLLRSGDGNLLKDLEIDDPIGNRAQNVSELGIIVTISGSASDMGGIADDISNQLNASRGFSDDLAAHTQQVQDYITGEIQSFNELNAAGLKTSVTTIMDTASGILSGAASFASTAISNASQVFSSATSAVSNAYNSLTDIHRGFDQRNPNTREVYDKINAIGDYLDTLSGISSAGTSQAGQFMSSYEDINTQMTAADVSSNIDAYADTSSAYDDFNATTNAINNALSGRNSSFDSVSSSISDSVESFLGSSSLMGAVSSATDEILNDTLTNDPQNTDLISTHQQVISNHMIDMMDTWSIEQIQSETQLADGYRILGVDISVGDVNTIHDDLYEPASARNDLQNNLATINSNINNLSDMGSIGEEIATTTQNISSMGSISDEIQSLRDEVNSTISHARPNHIDSINAAIDNLNLTEVQINDIITSSGTNATDIQNASLDLTNDVNDLYNIPEYEIINNQHSSLSASNEKLNNITKNLEILNNKYQESKTAYENSLAFEAKMKLKTSMPILRTSEGKREYMEKCEKTWSATLNKYQSISI